MSSLRSHSYIVIKMVLEPETPLSLASIIFAHLGCISFKLFLLVSCKSKVFVKHISELWTQLRIGSS